MRLIGLAMRGFVCGHVQKISDHRPALLLGQSLRFVDQFKKRLGTFRHDLSLPINVELRKSSATLL